MPIAARTFMKLRLTPLARCALLKSYPIGYGNLQPVVASDIVAREFELHFVADFD
jgi:hypothetical protein